MGKQGNDGNLSENRRMQTEITRLQTILSLFAVKERNEAMVAEEGGSVCLFQDGQTLACIYVNKNVIGEGNFKDT